MPGVVYDRKDMTRRKQGRKRWVAVGLLVAFAAAYTSWALLRPLGMISPEVLPLSGQRNASQLVWPAEQAAVGVVGTPILETHGRQTPLPAASTAKIITCLTILQAKPLKPGEQGPLVTITDRDVAIYNDYVAHDGSILPVQAGEKLSQYQMLQAIMLPSANNIADSLAIWAFGSLEAYSTAATAYLNTHGLHNTHVGSDASGLAPTSTSTAEDLVKLGKLAMENPVLADIVGQSTASNFPLAGTIRNVNFLLGSYNLVGLKTGNTDQAGGVYVSAARVQIEGKPITIVTALMGAGNLFAAMKDSLPLIQSAQTNFRHVEIIGKDAVVGRYHLPWGGTLDALGTARLGQSAWNGSQVTSRIELQPITMNARPGQRVGTVTTTSNLFPKSSVPVTLKTAPTYPTVWWRLTHPLE